MVETTGCHSQTVQYECNDEMLKSAYVTMQRYRWPGYEMQLLRELQKQQQNNGQFCDTLLQTEGISVPTHSCVLAALSPYLSKKLSASSLPPSGQKRQLQLRTVKAQTLLKLVGLLYSGELVVKGSMEQDDVLSAARKFGITDLVEGQRNEGVKKAEPQKKRSGSCRERKMHDAQVQAEMAGRRAADCPVEKRSCVSTGTQTVKAAVVSASQSKPPTQWCMSPGESLDFSITVQPQDITLDKHCNSSPLSGAPSDGESPLVQSSDSVTHPTSTSALPSNVTTFPICLNDDSISGKLQEDSSYQQSSDGGDQIGTEFEGEKTSAKMPDKKELAEQLSNRGEIIGEKRGMVHAYANVAKKSLAKMKQLQQIIETTETSVKVKMRRRNNGEVWEVVSIQETDETSSVHTSLKQTDLPNSEASVPPGPTHEPEIAQPAASNSPEPPPLPNTTSDSQILGSECLTPGPNNELESAPLAQPPVPVEESDEQIEKLLEDIMMGLNILPNLESDCKKSRHSQPSLDGAAAICQVPVTENDHVNGQMQAAVSAEGRVHYQDLGAQVVHLSTDTGSHCSTAQNQHSPSPVQSDPRHTVSHQGMLLSQGKNCPHPEAPTLRSAMPTAFYSSGQKLQYPACQESFSQCDRNIKVFLPMIYGNEAHPSHSFSLPCIDDLQLPPCLSPLESFASAAKNQPVFNNLMSHTDRLPKPFLHGRPWLKENPGPLQYPFSATTGRESVPVPQDTKQKWWSKRRKKHLEVEETKTELLAVKEGGTKSADHQHSADVKAAETKMKERCKRDPATTKRKKRKCASDPQDAADPPLIPKDVEVSNGRKSQISLSVCSVRLSTNNVLAKEREMATRSHNIPNVLLHKPGKLSAITESQTRIRTRGFMKKTQETPDCALVKPVGPRAKIVNRQGDSNPRRKRGRPKSKQVESTATTVKKTSNGVESEQQTDNNLQEEGEKTKRRCKKRRRNGSEVEMIPLKERRSAGKTKDANQDQIPAVAKIGTLKRQKLIKRQRSKTCRSKENQGKKAKDTAKDVGESEEKVYGRGCEELSEETEIDFTQPRSKEGIEESPAFFSVTVDKNQNLVFNKSLQDNTNFSKSLCGHEQHPAFSFDDLDEKVAKLAAETELKNPDEAQTACDAGDGRQQTTLRDEDSQCHRDTNTPPQGDKSPLDHKPNPRTPERTGPPPSDDVGVIESAACAGEENEDEEVEVLLYSPDTVPQSRECEKGLETIDTSPEEEEEEEDVDVTGDEAE